MTNPSRPRIDNVVERTLYIQVPSESGTAIALEVGDRQFLVTAKHIVEQPGRRIFPGDPVAVSRDDGTVHQATVKKAAASLGEPDAGGVDIGVIELNEWLVFAGQSPAIAARGDLYILQPVGLCTGEFWLNFGSEFGMPVRTGTVARIQPDKRGRATGEFMITVPVFPGASGSPVICWDDDGNPLLAGIQARWSFREVPALAARPRIYGDY